MSSFRVFILLALVLESNAQTSTPRYILSLVQNPDGVLAADTNVVFSCQAVVADISWLVGGVRFDDSTSTPEFTVVTDSNSTLSRLSTRAKGNENNTQVTCIATGSNSDRRTLSIVIAAAPLPPFLQVALFSNGSHLQTLWDRPFTMSGYPITSYTLDVVNKTNGERRKVILDLDLTKTMIYTLPGSGLPMSCHPLSFSVIATNVIGDSSASNIVTSGFSIFPRIDNVTLHIDLDTMAVLPRLTATFQAPEVCAFQNPATYTIGIFDEIGDEIFLTEPRLVPINSSVVVEVIEIRLDSGHFYSAELTVQHQNVPGEAFVTFIGIDFSRSLDSTTTGDGSAKNSISITVLASISMTVLLIINGLIIK